MVLFSESSGAFTEFLGGAGRLETATLPPASSFSSLLRLTRGLAAVIPRGAAGPLPPPTDVAHLTLPDGRLNVGTHLPLLARRYRYLSALGEGASAQVVLAEDTLASAPSRLVAIKIMRRQHAVAGQREARALRYLHAGAPGGVAPGVVQLLDTFMLGAHYCLVTERLFPWLLDWVAESSALPPSKALAQLRKMAHQLLLAVAFMHNLGLVSADIKPDNLLLCSPPGSRSVALRLVDFGGCFSLTETDTQAVGCEVQTLPYRAPEAALGLPYGAAIDLWSVGVVLAEMALKRALLPCAAPRDLLRQMVALLGPLPGSMAQGSALGRQMGLSRCHPAEAAPGAVAAPSAALPVALQERLAAAAAVPGLQVPVPRASCQLYAELAAVHASLADLVMGLLQYDPAQRLTAHQALLHPFFDPLCPLRAVFPQLDELCRMQQAALQTEAAAEAPAAAQGPAAPVPAPMTAAAPTQHLPLSPNAVAVAAAAEAEAAEAAAVALPATAQRWRRQQQQQGASGPCPQLRSSQASKAGIGRQQQPGEPAHPQPWQVLATALAQPQPPPSRLPAAQLAARQLAEQRRLAATDPYAGNFSLEVTPAKKQQLQGAYPTAAASTPLTATQQQQQPVPPLAAAVPKPSTKGRPVQRSSGAAGAALGTASAAAADARTGGRAPDGGRGASKKCEKAAGAAAGGEEEQQQQEEGAVVVPDVERREHEQASSFDLLLEAADVEEDWERQQQGVRRPGTKAAVAKTPHRMLGAARSTPAAAATAAKRRSGAKRAAAAAAGGGGTNGPQRRPKQQRPPPPLVAVSSDAGPAGKTPGKARAAAEQPASPAGGKTPAAQKRKQAVAEGSAGPAIVPAAAMPGTLWKKQKAAPGLKEEAPTKSVAAGALGGAEATPSTTAKRARRDKAMGEKPWWMVQS